MCGGMVDIQSAMAEIRRGKKKKEEKPACLFHRADIIRALEGLEGVALKAGIVHSEP